MRRPNIGDLVQVRLPPGPVVDSHIEWRAAIVTGLMKPKVYESTKDPIERSVNISAIIFLVRGDAQRLGFPQPVPFFSIEEAEFNVYWRWPQWDDTQVKYPTNVLRAKKSCLEPNIQ